jgi:ribonucleoside-diphosphate reductase alpha chain
MITGIFRKGGNISFVAEELQQIQSVHDGAWINSKYYGSLPAYIGHIIEQHLQHKPIPPSEIASMANATNIQGERCTRCGAPAIIHQEGCKECQNCGFNTC